MKGSGYNFIHAADMMYCADNHVRMMKTGESGFTVFRLLAKTGSWIWVQANARLVFKAGKPDFIVARQRALINEEGEDQLRLRRLQLPFNFATGEALLYDVAPTVDAPDPPDPCSAPKQRKLDDYIVSRESMLGCMLSQDQSLYCEHNKNNAFNSISDAAFKDSHATVSVPRDLWEPAAPRPEPVKSDATVQDMMETLQQILGENDLSEALDVGPEELKSWESTLLKMSSNSCEVSENLEDILSNDILTYVEEQLQREGALKRPDAAPECFAAPELRDQNPGWPPQPQSQLIPNGGPLRLTHMEAPPLALQQSAPVAPPTFDPFVAAHSQNQFGTLPLAAGGNGLLRPPAAGQMHPQQAALPMQSPPQTWTPSGLWDQSARGQHGFNAQGNAGSSASNFNQADHFLETYVQSIPSFPGGTVEGRFGLTTQSGADPRLVWSLEAPPAGAPLGNAPGHAGVGGPAFMHPQTPSVPFPFQPPAPAPLSHCAFRDAAPSLPLNGLRTPSKPACFYQALPGAGALPELDDAVLSCQVTASLPPDGVLSFCEQTQISRPAVGNGGFPFSSPPNAYYPDSQ